MAKQFQVQLILPMYTGLPRDVIVNTFHFLGDDEQSAEDVSILLAPDFVTLINGCYGTSTPSKSPYVKWADGKIKVYDLSQPKPRVPAEAAVVTAAGSESTTVPTEVACVATFRAAPEAGTIYQRLYNRVYLGGIANSWMSPAGGATFPRFSPTKVAAVAAAFEAFHAAVGGPSEIPRWMQKSSASGLDELRPIVGGWVDDGPDTQRRRSVLASARTVWTV